MTIFICYVNGVDLVSSSDLKVFLYVLLICFSAKTMSVPKIQGEDRENEKHGGGGGAVFIKWRKCG